MFNNRKFCLSISRNFNKTTELAPMHVFSMLLKMKPRSQVFHIQALPEVTLQSLLNSFRNYLLSLFSCTTLNIHRWGTAEPQLLNSNLNDNAYASSQSHTQLKPGLLSSKYIFKNLFSAFLSSISVLNAGYRFLAVMITRWGQLISILLMILIS